jgi:hypothetical protein
MREPVLAWHPLALILCYVVPVPHGTCRLWCQGPVLELLTRACGVCRMARCQLLQLVAGMMPPGRLGGRYGMYENAFVGVHA